MSAVNAKKRSYYEGDDHTKSESTSKKAKRISSKPNLARDNGEKNMRALSVVVSFCEESCFYSL